MHMSNIITIKRIKSFAVLKNRACLAIAALVCLLSPVVKGGAIINSKHAPLPDISRSVSHNTLPPVTNINIAFLASTATAPAGYTADNGLAYTDARGFGWVNPTTKAPQDMSANMRIRTGSSERRLLGVAQMQANTNGQQPGTWECAVVNGTYRVTIGAGDESYYDSNTQINAEGFPVIADLFTSTSAKHKIAIGVVTVTDGKLTIDANGGVNSKINFVTIAPADPVTDAIAPTAGIRLEGTLNGSGAYTNQVKVYLTGTDTGGAGLDSLKYSINNGAYVNYTVPFVATASGSYSIKVKAVDANNNNVITNATTFSVAGQPAGTSRSIVFRPSTSNPPTGYTADNGLAYTDARGFGWVNPTTKAPADVSANMRIRTGTSEARLLGVAQMQATTNGQQPGTWECAVINGTYRVTIGAGDEGYYDSNTQINAEGLPVIADLITSASAKHKVAIGVVTVTDGKLTIDANGGVNSKINFVTIAPATDVTDAVAPAATIRLAGTLNSPGVYLDQVQVLLSGTDSGGAGLDSLKYSLNNAPFVNYTTPITINTVGNYTIVAKAVDANNNKATTSATAFQVATVVPPATYMVLKNPDGFPADDRLLFSKIKTPWRRVSPDTTPYNANHDRIKLRINNKGAARLTVTKLLLSNPAAWKIASVGSDTLAKVPFNVNSGAFTDVTIQFITEDAGTRLKLFNDTLSITSNDSIAPVKKVKLSGVSQLAGEGVNEPYAQQLLTASGYMSITGYGSNDGNLDGSARVPNSSEVVASYFVRADESRPVTVKQVAAYHGCCSTTEAIRYFKKGATGTTMVFTHNGLDGQSVMPRMYGSTTLPAAGTFTPTPGSFGFRVGSSSTDRTQNYNGLIGIRILKAMDGNGNIIPNAYFFNCDYLGTSFTNYDYQDNIYYVENIKPDEGSLHYADLIATPKKTVNFNPAATGSSTSYTLTLQNSGIAYPDGTNDSPITLKSVQIVGPNAAEFSVSALKTATLAVQATTTLTVKFNPTTVGLKNAVLLVNYNSASAPLRVPLYGIGNTTTSTVNVVKRIKSGSDVAMTLAGNVYESDKNYRAGSIKLDVQTVKTPVLATDIDSLYQTYLSAAADLAETRYNITIPNGDYVVRMHFVENYWTAPGARVFNTIIEDKVVLTNFDIYSEVGYRQAIVKDVPVTVTDGVMNFKFNPTANRLGIAGVEIFQVQPVSLITSAVRTLSNLSVTDNENQERKIALYPNPNGGQVFNLTASNFSKNESVTLTITSMAGFLLQTQTFNTDDSGVANIQVRLNTLLSKGVYIINASSNTGSAVSKLLVQ